VLSRDAAVVGVASLSGTGAAGGAGGPWTERRGAGPAWVEDLGEAAMTRGRWRGGRGGDSEREVARRGRQRRPEGGSDEGEVTTKGR